MASLAEIRAKLQEQENRRKGSGMGGGDNAIYPFWNIPEGSTATLRFLPDANESNSFFWVERQMIRIPFAGVKGGDENRQVVVQVPCVEMWGETCPIHAEIRPWFKDKNMEDLGRRYWKKRSYIMQGFVVNSPLAEDTVPENPIRRFVINPSIFNIIKSALMDPEMEELPTDFQRGTDFRLTKTTKGQYADYATSAWARKERSLGQEELEAIQKHGLFNLNDFMPKKPNADELAQIFDMFQSSVEGELFDPQRFTAFRPGGMSVNADADDTPATSATSVSRPAPKVVDDEPPVVAAPKATTAEAPAATSGEDGGKKPSVEEILQLIKARRNQ